MMFEGTPFGSNPTSPFQDCSPTPDQSDAFSPALLPHTLPCWATQALCDLAQAEAELHKLQERHTNETESVKRGVERAILGAHREERRLLERVEQDHRDTQQHLEQVRRENTAAARVSQSLLEQRLSKLIQLQQQIQEMGQKSRQDQSGPNQNLLLKEVTEFLQPWEISISLKKVNFKPSSQPNTVTFGEIRVQEQNLCLHVGDFGPQGQMCALHSREMQIDTTHQNARGQKSHPGQGLTSPTGRVIKKISLSTQSDLESEEKQKMSSSKIYSWLPKCEQSEWELPQNDEMESALFKPQAEDVFQAVTTTHENVDVQGNERKINSNGKHYSPRNQRESLSVVSGRKLSPTPKRRRDHSMPILASHEGDEGKLSQDSTSKLLKQSVSTRMTPREPVTSQSCLDLSSRGCSHSHLSQSSDEHSLGTLGDSGRAPSPSDSLDSSYTFIISPSHDYSMSRGSLNYNCRRSKSAVDLTHKAHPLFSSGTNEDIGIWSMKCCNFNSMSSSTSTSPALSKGSRVPDMGHVLSYPTYRGHNVRHQPQKEILVAASKQSHVARSLSMSVIDGSSPEPKRGRGERGESALVEMEEEGDMTVFNPRGVHLIRQFGKQGSGRADFTLPSGIHATPQGQLFIVDCGNARVQVTDPRGNVLQQVTSPTSDGSARRCRNYFDIAVNAKGLIALSCAAERALLVFSRHGRLLQTFGGSGLGSRKDDLEAPRGVTVTRIDEFLVADIRKGTLIALKLDPKTGSRLERTVVTGFHRPYLVAACLTSGMVAVSERGNETGRVPCIKVLEPGWNTVRVLGVCAGMGPILACPWGICIDTDGNVLVADWGEQHRVLLYPAQGVGWPILTQGLSSPRGLTLLPEGQVAVSDSMNHCIKIYQYKGVQD
ncbi:hypothetical protein Q8A73_009754 [Channa argus]|nr:hypothetical protein Q8A73_009754 [Channa argus]